MNDDSEMIADSKVTHLRRRQTAKPSTAFSPAFANRVKHAVAQMCRTNVAAVEKPLDNLLLSVAELGNDGDGDPDDQVDVSEFVKALRLARAAIPDRTERDCTQVYKYIERLAEPHRSIVTFRFAEGLTYHDIAKRVDIDPRTVCEILARHWSAMGDIYDAAPARRAK